MEDWVEAEIKTKWRDEITGSSERNEAKTEKVGVVDRVEAEIKTKRRLKRKQRKK